MYSDDPLAAQVDDGGHAGVAARPKQAGDVGDVKGLQRQHEEIYDAHGDGDLQRPPLQMEQRIEIGDEHRRQDVYKRKSLPYEHL